MANWKKIIVSGSDAELNNITSSGGIKVAGVATFNDITATGLANQGSEATAVMINGSNVVGTRELGSNAFTSTTIGTATNALTVDNATIQLNSGTTFDGSGAKTISVKDGGIDEDALATSVAGDGLTGGGGSALAVSLNEFSEAVMASGDSIVFIDANDSNNSKKESFADLVTLLAGDGLQNSSNTIAIDASEIAGSGLEASGENLTLIADATVLTSVTNTSLTIGRDADNLIKFNTDNKIIFEVGGSDNITFDANGHVTASGLTVSGKISASSGITGSLQGTASFVDSLAGAALADGKIPIGDTNGVVAEQTLSGAITITRAGVTSLANDIVTAAKIDDGAVGTDALANDAVTGAKLANDVTIANDLTVSNDLTVTGNLQVNGTTTQVQVANLNVEDRFILLNSGSDSGDGGIIVQTGGGTGNKTGAGFGFDDSADRWVITSKDTMQFDDTAFAVADLAQFLVAVSGSNGAPSGNPADFGSEDASRIGMMVVDTSTEDIYIWS